VQWISLSRHHAAGGFPRRKEESGKQKKRFSSVFRLPPSAFFQVPGIMAKKPPASKRETETPAPETGYTVLARRYRPQTFADLVGQEPVARALANAIKGNRVAHAYLFTGARGVGKTSTARILAKALNCEKGPTDTPCDQCDICKSIAAGEDIDVLEIDGASSNSVDNVREIRQNAQFRPSRARYKIYIIDEVHMLAASPQKSAFNALLKTLEEPPPHVKFIFATTEVQKIPLTILSRCQRFDFAGIGLEQIKHRLREIVDREGMKADDEALELVARRAGGSMRDAQSLLDQLLAFGGDRLTADTVHQLLGTAGDDRVAGLAQAVLAHDPKQALELLDEALVGGLQLGELLDQLIAYWRDLMVVQVGGIEGRDLSVPPRLRETLVQQANSLNLDSILAGLDVLSATKARLRGSNHGRTLIEMALVRLGRLDDLVSLAQLAQWVGQGKQAQARATDSRSESATKVSLPEGVKKKSVTLEPTNGAAVGPTEVTEETLPEIWREVVNLVGPLLGRDLEKANIPAIFGPNSLVLRFPVDYNQSREHCQEPSRLARVEEAMRKVTGRPWNIRVETSSSPDARPHGTGAEAVSGVRPRRDDRAEAEKDPLVKRAVEVLGASLVRVDEGFGSAPVAPGSIENTTTEGP
jgi:DNA polymerase III subunit gamma/tau